MKRVILIIFTLAIAFSASAQYATVPQGTLKARGAKIFCDGQMLTLDETKIVFSDFGGVDRSGEYLSNRRGYRTGLGLSVGGASFMIVSGAAAYVTTAVVVVAGTGAGLSGEPLPEGLEAALYGTYAATAAGALIMLAGIPTAAVYQHRIKRMTSDYNALGKSSRPVLTFGPASSGIGIAMSF